MPIEIRASVVDIRTDEPTKADIFFVDTNVWYWMGYTRASNNAEKYQVKVYPQYLEKALDVGSSLYKCALSFSEIAHLIERTEREIYNEQNGTNIYPKDFRYNYHQQREKILDEIRDTWQLANAMTGENTLEVNATNKLVDKSIERLNSVHLDGYDLFMVETLFDKEIAKVITDDADFGQVPGLTVFTSNNRLIDAARDQKRLLPRRR